ncbi:hypothetical protein BJ138DRAFT_377761 [Hygrophoropsis aurantiaca]|uniref:Uncharacterized protein n=1 Tax=Hygrophoropsis aurantiaca TaxID=72124 RepID=A0ACB8A693_9AGAM|nr:hypothetical protein BJ138DRAFT_377761 [Hygrophoropsis aurantiaca]
MATYTSFAIAGAGPSIGIPIVKALLSRNARVLVLSRPSSSSVKLLPEHDNLKVAPVDYADTAAVSALLQEHNIRVLISAMSYQDGALDAQRPLADAAKAAGVELFVPSEYGLPSAGAVHGVSATKEGVAAYLKDLGISSLRLFNGLFQEYIPWVTAVDETGEFNVVGRGETPVSFTAIADVAGYLAHVLTKHPPAKLANVQLRIEGQRASLSEIYELYRPRSKIPVKYVDSIAGTVPVRDFLQGEFEKGAGSTGWDNELERDDAAAAGSANGLWDDHKWITIAETLQGGDYMMKLLLGI